jgi:FkbM family methyltransferase
MRRELFYNPWLLCERLAELSVLARRRKSLRGTPASWLTNDHIGSLELLRQLSPAQSAVVYDVGANVGTWTLLLKAIHPHAVVHGFEPLTGHVDGFRANTASLKDVHLHQIALGEAEATGSMHVTSFSDASSLLPLANAGAEQWHIHEVAREAVQIESMDHWQARAGVPFATLIKLDVQGFELAVLRGASRCLAHAEAVLLEVSFQEYYEGQCLFADVVAFLASHGFALNALGHDTSLGRRLIQADALFIADRRPAR